jgi:DNA processing protein
MTWTESAALVALLRNGTRPWPHYAGMVEESGSALAVLERETSGRRHGQASLFADPAQPEPEPERMLKCATADIERWRGQGMKLLTVLDADYPDNLRTVHDRPPLIFVSGDLRAEDARSVAVVGTREPSVAGAAEAAAVAEHLVDAGFTVVSGLATGIDTAVHEASLARGGRTVAVVGTGLHRVYPPQNADLQRRISQAGAVISQFWPEAPPSRQSFPMRNAVMSGLTLGSVVVEATRTSGARVQARLALAHGRPVFLLRRLTREDWAREFATRPGAHVVDEPAEITQIIGRLTSAGVLSP